MAKNKTQNKTPLVAIRNVVVFPNVITPLFIGRKFSGNAVNHALSKLGQVVVLTQVNPNSEDIEPENLYRTGTLCNIAHVSKIPNSIEQKIILDPIKRVCVTDFEKDEIDELFFVNYETVEEDVLTEKEKLDATVLRTVLSKTINEYIALNGKLPQDILSLMFQVETLDIFVDIASSISPGSVKEKHDLLEETNLVKRLEVLQDVFIKEIHVLNYENLIQGKIKASLTKYQKEGYIKEQISVLKKELDGLDENGGTDSEKYEKLLNNTSLSEEASIKVKDEIKKLGTISHYSSEGSIVKGYLDMIFSLPWGQFSEQNIDLKKASEILDEQHFGMKKVKDRILEYISVQTRLLKPKGAILCLYGPPGVGKTSLVKSIAKAMGREYAKISLGGMRDEAEIRGHRKTYIGAFAGKIISAMKKAGTNNPVILLDEIDKISDSYKGDPAAALLEVLDPEQNKTFQDNYLEFGYDLSNVIFIATANSLNISYPLLDRMDVINLSGYTELEKLKIAEGYLFKKALENTGLKSEEISVQEGVLLNIIRNYTREAGVRSLEREINVLLRKVLKRILEEKDSETLPISVEVETLKEFLGVKKYDFEKQNSDDIIGVTTGLAYTEAGGDILMIEAVKVAGGKGEIKTTGKLGDVMKESMQAALSYVQSHASEYGISETDFQNHNIHIHVPEGATPKDGPSAGVAIATSIISLFSGKKVNKNVAMTGEITLHGKVLPIGGLKEKLMSAVRSNIKTVLIPFENEKDLEDISHEIKDKLTIIPIKTAKEAMAQALV
jgi:ATP-dependent Lon protease